jgi:haloalkane dehalogenase
VIDATVIERHFATVDTRWGVKQIHYRRCGSGPAVLLLHQSPQSSAEYQPLMRQWAGRFTVIAPDYPGFGMSDAFGEDGELELGLPDFAEVLIAFMDEIGVSSAAAYGFHTGAGMAVAMADHSPSHISAVYANGYVILNEQERAEILSGYLPPFEPQWDASHLLWMWTRNRDQLIFFPWFDRRAEARISRSIPPPEILQQWAMELLRAGDHYRVGYRAAFVYPGDVPLRTLQLPAIITATDNDVLGAFLPRITAPADTVQARVGGSMEDNLAEAAAFFQQHATCIPPPVSDTRSVSGCAWNKTIATENGFIRIRCDLEAQGQPVLLVHGAGGDCESVEPVLQSLRGRRPVIALDLPGHGESDGLPQGVDFLPACRAAIIAVLNELDYESVDAWGQWGGATILADFASFAPARINSLVLSGVQHVSKQQGAELAERFAPEIEPNWHGGHLIEYWHVARNQSLFWPWYEQTDAAATQGDPRASANDLHQRTLALMKSAAVLRRAARELFNYPLVGTLKQLPMPVMLAAASWDPNKPHTEAAAAELLNVSVQTLPDDSSSWGEVLLGYFEGARK